MHVGAPGGARSGNQINFRGLPSVRQLKDGFPTYPPQDTYNTERIEISRGPDGINLTSRRGQFRNLTDFATRLDDRGSRRFTIDFDRVNADEFVVSPFFKYAAKFGRVRWTGQLNVDNAFNNVTNQGRIARYVRYTDPRLVTLTNTFQS